MESLLSDSFVVESEVLGEEREIYVYLPPGHGESGEVYPVVYLLDGDRLHNVVSAFVQHYSSRGRIPPLIVVGIESGDRMRDFTSTVRKGRDGGPVGGGADGFLRFLSEELFPRVEGRYSCRDYRVLIGHSLGGLFVVYSVIAEPEMFRAYVASSPWFGVEDEPLISRVGAYLREGPPDSKLLYVAHEPIGKEGIEVRILSLVRVLRENEREDFAWRYRRYEDADHSNLPLKAVPDALDFLFPGIVLD